MTFSVPRFLSNTVLIALTLTKLSFAQEDDVELDASIDFADANDTPEEPKEPPIESAVPVSDESGTAAPPATDAVSTEAPAPTAEPDAAASSELAAGGALETPLPDAPGSQFVRSPYSRPIRLGLSFGGYLQAQYQLRDDSEDQLNQGGVPLNRDQFSLRSARFRIESGHTFSAYDVELDATTLGGMRVGVRRAEGTLLYRGENGETLPPLVAVSAGLIDLPFGHDLPEAASVRWFTERTIGSEALFPSQMDVGVKLFGAWRFARYAIAVVNGEPVKSGAWPHDPNAVKDFVGRVGAEADLGAFLRVSGGTSFTFGKGFSPGRAATKDTISWRDDNEDGNATATEIFGIPGAAATPSRNFQRWALGIDLQLELATSIGNTRLLAEAYAASNHDRGLFVADPVVTGVDLRHLGGYVALTQELTRYALVGVRASFYDPNTDAFEQRRGNFTPRSQSIGTVSPLVGLVLDGARLVLQYDWVVDDLARDAIGVPIDAKNDVFTVRLQVEL